MDCLTLWLTRVMDRHDAWDDDAWAATAEKAVAARSTRCWRPGARRRAGSSRSPTRSARAWCPTASGGASAT